MMSPKMKKILMIGGAAVAGYLVYTKVIKKPESAPASRSTEASTATAVAQLTAQGPAARFTRAITKRTGSGIPMVAGLGSLGGGFR